MKIFFLLALLVAFPVVILAEEPMKARAPAKKPRPKVVMT